MNKDRENNYNY